MDKATGSRLREALFRLSVTVKGLDALLELLGGLMLLLIKPAAILQAVAFVTQDELAEDPRDLVANYLLHLAGGLTLGAERFAALYLAAHGVIKIVFVVALLRGKLWAYPAAAVVFAGFVAYQLYRFTLTGAIGLVALSVFDVWLIAWIVIEYLALRRRPSG
ncbi:MAG TPA: DUF2127 domain-containing protein [Caulobacteraceae bacterium]|nr:DUF2127 domain-containing protein [Caulobacteraceae bacterium]